ncbi:MAG: hypothetical protein E7598_06850 [Ruminococcaceae bacterium]|nr:hypothetical protein [Oscillospiraceae bacterium]
MGKMLGAHDSEELDRPDLNKCPDCGCFFADDNCPFCGKECPEEFRAGNRKAVKKKKVTQTGTGRVTFVEWYHTWWAIGLAMVFFPVVAFVLLATSPHKTKTKVIVILVVVLITAFSWFGLNERIIAGAMNLFTEPLDRYQRSLGIEEYKELCESVNLENFYRSAEAYNDKFVSMTFVIDGIYSEKEGFLIGSYYKEYPTYYLCKDENGGEFAVFVRNCVKESPKQYVKGDKITVYGVGKGMYDIDDWNYSGVPLPTVYAAYIELN